MLEIERRFVLRSAAAVGAVALFPWSAHSETAVDPAHLTGPDRTARLIAGAKKEGMLNLYSSAIAEHMNATSATVAYETDEFALAGLTSAPSSLVTPPRVAEIEGRPRLAGIVKTVLI